VCFDSSTGIFFSDISNIGS
jgi:hypothetical protein